MQAGVTGEVMLERLGHLVVRRRRTTLVLFVLGLVAAAVVGSGVFSRLQSAGFDDPRSDSFIAAQQLRTDFGVADPVAAIAVVTPHGLDADAAVATTLVRRLQAEPGVGQVVSYWTSGRPASLAGRDGRTGEVLVFGAANATDVQQNDLAKRLTAAYEGDHGGLDVRIAGPGAVNNAINDTITKDLARADSIAVPRPVGLLGLVLGGLVAAGLPFLVALGAVLGGFAILF